MLAAVAVHQDPDDPLSGLKLRDVPRPTSSQEWAVVRVMAASLNYHDLWTLRGVGHPADRLPIVLGCDAAGIDEDGNEVVVHAVFGDPAAGGGDETLDPGRVLMSERHDGSFAESVRLPRSNLLPKPASLTFEEAACLPVTWLTAYRMLFTQARIRPGDRVLVQGAGGGVSTAAIALARGAGATVYATSRSEYKRAAALELGAHVALPTGARLPERVDAVVETVGEATWEHSQKSLRPGGTIVVAGATSGPNPPADLNRVFYFQQRVLGSTGGTRAEFIRLLRFVDSAGIRPRIDRVLPLAEIHSGFRAMLDGELTGKVVVRPN
ncbi:zinc-binding dehydrogenase [Streptomyces sp. NPDC057474]|uniref:zinc-binding dehydrogenase n=1 Tax=Streptomyces sp. NPDC057474 TaxID=3346144 RepID=UPI00369CA9D8